jgi:hypothetical protein
MKLVSLDKPSPAPAAAASAESHPFHPSLVATSSLTAADVGKTIEMLWGDLVNWIKSAWPPSPTERAA